MASPVTASTRTVYTVAIGGKPLRFFTAGAAWYALAKSLVGSKYLPALRMVEGYDRSAFVDPPTDAERARADRADALFFRGQPCDDNGGYPREFCTKKWAAYVRRVARKLRALDEYQAKAVRRG